MTVSLNNYKKKLLSVIKKLIIIFFFLLHFTIYSIVTLNKYLIHKNTECWHCYHTHQFEENDQQTKTFVIYGLFYSCILVLIKKKIIYSICAILSIYIFYCMMEEKEYEKEEEKKIHEFEFDFVF